MNILVINNSNPFFGSGIVALDLIKEFQKEGHSVKLVVNEYKSNYPEGVLSMESFCRFWQKRILNKVKKLLKLETNYQTDPKYRFHELNEKKLYYSTKFLLRKAKIRPDVIFILFVKEFLNARNIFELDQRTHAPVYWLMYDMAPFTGGCHYSWECKGYQNSCGNCPGLYSSDPFDLTYKNLLFKRKYVSKTNIQIITGSEWQYQQAKNSSLFRNKSIHKILLSINPSVFKPVRKKEIRKNLGIPSEKKVVFFGSVGLTDLRKGMLYLIESLKILKEKISKTNPDLEKDILLLTAGKMFDGIVDALPFEYVYLGLLDNTTGIASAFQASDVFVCPSVEDSGPMMINQSIMCGIPVVSFEMGVALDLVETGSTGYRAKIKDSFDLAQGIHYILTLDSEKYSQLSNNCRERALSLYSPEVHISQICKIIKDKI